MEQWTANFVPVRQYIPARLQQHLPNRFLDLAIVDSHETDARLEAAFPGRFADVFIFPTADISKHMQYEPRCGVVYDLKKKVPPRLFAAMLDSEVLAVLEGETPEEFTW